MSCLHCTFSLMVNQLSQSIVLVVGGWIGEGGGEEGRAKFRRRKRVEIMI